MTTLTGPDVSRWQGTVDWPAVASDGHAFAWCKASQGVTWRDPQFARNWVGIAAAGMVRGAYHFLDAEYGGREQAAHFVSTVGSFARSMAALDVEAEGASNPTIEQAEAFAAEFARLTGGHPLVIYTGLGWWGPRDRTGRGARISPWLWHARYRSLDQGPGPLYGGWTFFAFWQHTSSGRCRGVAGDVDLNVLYGGRPVLAQLTRPTHLDPTPVPQEDDDDMKPHKVHLVDKDRYAYVIPDGTVVDLDYQGDRLTASSVKNFEAVYERGQANAAQVDQVQAAVKRARA